MTTSGSFIEFDINRKTNTFVDDYKQMMHHTQNDNANQRLPSRVVIMFNPLCEMFWSDDNEDLPGNAPSNINYNHHNVCVVENITRLYGQEDADIDRIDPDDDRDPYSMKFEIASAAEFEGQFSTTSVILARDPDEEESGIVLEWETCNDNDDDNDRTHAVYVDYIRLFFHYDDPRPAPFKNGIDKDDEEDEDDADMEMTT
jgi:hypothetical protein